MAVTQAQIAEMVGVSRGTVDRALNNRGRVAPEVAARIREIADELGYHPNRAGSLLVRSKRPLRLGIIIQSAQTPFIATLLSEIEQARANMLERGAELLVRTTQTIDAAQQLAMLNELAAEKVDGIALTPVEEEQICNRIDMLAEQGIPIVTFNTDIPGAHRLCYVGQDSYLSGRTCAGLMHCLLGDTGTVLMITGYVSNRSHQRRIDGFRSEISSAFPGISLLPVERCSDSDGQAHDIVIRTLKENPQVRGIYFSAGGAPGGCAAVSELGLRSKVHIICHDLTPANARNLQDGLLDFLIDQDAHVQAVRPLETLLDYILTGTPPQEEYMLTRIDIRTRYNI